MTPARDSGSPAFKNKPAVMRGFRIAGYLLLAAGLLEAAVLFANVGQSAGLAVEEGPLEAVQVIMAFIASTLFFMASLRYGSRRDVLELFAVVMFGFAIRELDNFLDERFMAGAYVYALVPVIGYALSILWRARRTLIAQAEELADTPTFYLIAFGAFILVFYAQVVGQEELWRGIASSGDTMAITRLAEEVAEAPGYLCLLFAAIEACIGVRRENLLR